MFVCGGAVKDEDKDREVKDVWEKPMAGKKIKLLNIPLNIINCSIGYPLLSMCCVAYWLEKIYKISTTNK